MPRPKQNLYGQEMGNKGILTRTRIMKATADLMERRPLRELRVAEIGALAAVSSSTFYLYFASVAEAGLAVIEELNQTTPEVSAILSSEWNAANVLVKARALVQAHVSFWDKHHALLRVRNFAADEGDKRFFDARRRAIEPIHLGLQEKIRHFQECDPCDVQLDPPSTASVLLAMLERTAALVRLPSSHNATRPRQIESAAYLIASAMTCVHSSDGKSRGARSINQGRGSPTGRAPRNARKPKRGVTGLEA